MSTRRSRAGYAGRFYTALRMIYDKPRTPAQIRAAIDIDAGTLVKSLDELQRHGIVCVPSYEVRNGQQVRTYAFGSESAPGVREPTRRPRVSDISMRVMLQALMTGYGYTVSDLVEETGLHHRTVHEHLTAMRVAGLVYRVVPPYSPHMGSPQYFFGVGKKDKVSNTVMTPAERMRRYREKKLLQNPTNTILLQLAIPRTAPVQLPLSKRPIGAKQNGCISSQRRNQPHTDPGIGMVAGDEAAGSTRALRQAESQAS